MNSPEPLAAILGTDAAWDLSLYDAQGDPLAFSDLDVLSATVWQGGGSAELFAPAAAWTDSAAGQFRLAVAANDTDALDPGTYALAVRVATYSGLTLPAFEGFLQLDRGSGGVEDLGPTYCTVDDMRDHGGGDFLDLLRRESGYSNFARERARARTWFDQIILGKYRPWDRGSVNAFSGPISDAPNPTLSDYLASECLIVTDSVREANACKALELVCRNKVSLEGNDHYQRRAGYFRALADRAAATSTALIDTNDDGRADLAIKLNVVSIR